MIMNIRLNVPPGEPEPDLAAAKLLRAAADTLERNHTLDPTFGTVRDPGWGPIVCVWSWLGDQHLNLLGAR